ncbi:ATP-binding protein [Conexibacter arvalis]|uniref:Anti-sigma regulatory factor (Ser/Thr protein kinase) n=1 Tax=Conexibacter arvalis TaxID=912552 RepID=A0A840IHP4_9ACTN|nr:ATP-binding protein [Conexibacter arvalis]MBB4663574.1 anti-sigma regulatory factor (Ser/Thr protein kinase) [Conexibacter arvalis]
MADGRSPGGVAIALDADADAPTRARHAAAAALGTWPSDRRDSVLLVISELVTNAVRHGSCDRRDRVALTIRRRDDTTRIEVVDSRARGGRVEEIDRGDGVQRSGWGLPIVAQLTDRWGVERGPGRTCVWCEIDDL